MPLKNPGGSAWVTAQAGRIKVPRLPPLQGPQAIFFRNTAEKGRKRHHKASAPAQKPEGRKDTCKPQATTRQRKRMPLPHHEKQAHRSGNQAKSGKSRSHKPSDTTSFFNRGFFPVLGFLTLFFLGQANNLGSDKTVRIHLGNRDLKAGTNNTVANLG